MAQQYAHSIVEPVIACYSGTAERVGAAEHIEVPSGRMVEPGELGTYWLPADRSWYRRRESSDAAAEPSVSIRRPRTKSACSPVRQQDHTGCTITTQGAGRISLHFVTLSARGRCREEQKSARGSGVDTGNRCRPDGVVRVAGQPKGTTRNGLAPGPTRQGTEGVSCGATELATLAAALGATVSSAEPGQLDIRGLDPAHVGEAAATAGLVLHELTLVQGSLEEAYMQLTHGAVEYSSSRSATDLEGSRR